MPGRLAENLVMFIRQNNGTLPKSAGNASSKTAR
jgi:hypothetical protein